VAFKSLKLPIVAPTLRCHNEYIKQQRIRDIKMAHTYDDEIYSDLHKDARGYRPGESGFNYWNSLTPDEKQSHWDCLIEDLECRNEERLFYEREAAILFENRVALTVQSGAKDRATAIRWIFEAEGDDYAFNDPDYFCFQHGLAYGYFAEIAPNL
jgi:hypothetical protein